MKYLPSTYSIWVATFKNNAHYVTYVWCKLYGKHFKTIENGSFTF